MKRVCTGILAAWAMVSVLSGFIYAFSGVMPWAAIPPSDEGMARMLLLAWFYAGGFTVAVVLMVGCLRQRALWP